MTNNDIQKTKHCLDILTKSTKYTINKILKNNLDFACVYIISAPDNDAVIYAGQTGNISQRMKDHMGNDLFQKLKLNNQDSKWYNVRYRRMMDPRQRTLFEHFVIGALKPKHND